MKRIPPEITITAEDFSAAMEDRRIEFGNPVSYAVRRVAGEIASCHYDYISVFVSYPKSQGGYRHRILRRLFDAHTADLILQWRNGEGRTKRQWVGHTVRLKPIRKPPSTTKYRWWIAKMREGM